jgi:hypothetical protein
MVDREIAQPVMCSVTDGRFVVPCSTLMGVIDSYAPGFSRAKGVFIQNLTNMNTGQPSRAYIGIKSKAHPNGFLFNFCPFCGTDISAPFMKGGA